MDKPKRVAVIGLDCTVMPLMEQLIAEGHLPTLKKIFEGGAVAENCLVPFPTITPPNWATIGTGAWPGTHGVTDFWLPIPGATPNNSNTVKAMSSDRVKAEYLWDAADKAGKRCIVLNFPGAWPSHMNNGILVAGAGLTPGSREDGFPSGRMAYSLCGNQMITTGVYPDAIRATWVTAEDWETLEEPGEEPLEMEAEVRFPSAIEPVAPATWYVLARQMGDEGYSHVTLSPSRDLREAFCTLAVGEWSPKVTTRIRMADGTEREASFRCKLLELSDDAEDFRLFLTSLSDLSRWTSPPEVAARLVSPEGVPVANCGMVEYKIGWFDSDTFVDCNRLYGQWLGDAAAALLRDGDWDLFFMHSHPIDFAYHGLLSAMDPAINPDRVSQRRAREAHRQIYQDQDRMVSQILEAAGEDTLVVLVSDHGAVADGPTFDPYDALVQAGLATVTQAAPAATDAYGAMVAKMLPRAPKVDYSRTRAIPQRTCYVYVHLKGRDPEGIVEPEDYEKVQQQIIDALITYVDPATGQRPVALALSKRDARILGLYGDLIGDVVYATYPWYSSQHGPSLPTAEWGIGSLKGTLVLHGPGIRKGARLKRTVGLQDLVPTLCYLADLPLPSTVEGAVIYQAFEDPNFKRAETAELMGRLAGMEAALSGRGG